MRSTARRRSTTPRGRLLCGRLSYANVASTLALVFAMSGGALAAHHYLISSTKQISPKVLRKLHGAHGQAGAPGPVGPQGLTGEAGPKGGRGPAGLEGFSALSTLPAGATENGDFALSVPRAAPLAKLVAGASFPIVLAAGVTPEHVLVTSAATPVVKLCEGVGRAARGYLCVYTSATSNVEKPVVSNPESATPAEGTGRFGFKLAWTVSEEGAAEAAGSWSVTG